MKKIIVRVFVTLFVSTLTACSISPGMPGLVTNSKVSNIHQKEGVHYKLVVINSETLKKQKNFDYASYVRSKKKKIELYRRHQKVNTNSSNTRKPVAPDNNITKSFVGSSINPSTLIARRGKSVSDKDVKSKYQYHIGKGDVLKVTVWDHPELSVKEDNGHVVGIDGRFYFPFSGKIYAVGKTVGEIRDELEVKLRSFITKPQVSVDIISYRSKKAYTSGAIVNPTTLVVNDVPITIRDAISKSGGLIPNQYTGYATLSRSGENISIDLNRMLKHNDNRQNFIMRNGDSLNVIERLELDEFKRKLNLDVVKENTLSSVRLRNEVNTLNTLNPLKLKYALEKERSLAQLKNKLENELKSEHAKAFVMGEVHKPGSVKYKVEDGMTLAEAINDAGSFKEETVDPKGIFVVRKEDVKDEIPTVYQLSIASVQSMFFAEQFEIRPRDIVYVTATPSIRWNRVLSQLLPSVTVINAFK